jgi:hypothetical protein
MSDIGRYWLLTNLDICDKLQQILYAFVMYLLYLGIDNLDRMWLATKIPKSQALRDRCLWITLCRFPNQRIAIGQVNQNYYREHLDFPIANQMFHLPNQLPNLLALPFR